jgi:hypothetical protein
MGRNQTVQDALRLFTLAPDFLEARLRFAGQALRPGGMEQVRAFIVGALGMAIAAQIVNMLFGDDHEPHWDKPFSVIIGKTTYTPRSVIGDMWHLFADPRSFVYHRLNPTYTRPGLQFLTGRDVYGQKRTFVQSTTDMVKSWAPIPSQGFLRKAPGESTLHSVVSALLGSVGVSPYPYRSKAIQAMRDIRFDKDVRYRMTPESEATEYIANKIRNRKNLTSEDITKLASLGLTDSEGNMTTRFQSNLENRLQYTSEQRMFKMLTFDEALKVYKLMDEEEQKLFGPIMETKYENYQNQHETEVMEENK